MPCHHCHRSWIIGGNNLGVFRFKDYDETSDRETEVAYCMEKSCIDKAQEHKIAAMRRRIKAGILCGHVDDYAGATPCTRESAGRHLGCKYHPVPNSKTVEFA